MKKPKIQKSPGDDSHGMPAMPSGNAQNRKKVQKRIPTRKSPDSSGTSPAGPIPCIPARRSVRVEVAKFGPWRIGEFGTPWLARLSVDSFGKLVHVFDDGAFSGSSLEGGSLSAELREGEYFAWGQKGYGGNPSIYWCGAVVSGKISEIPKTIIRESLISGGSSESRRNERLP